MVEAGHLQARIERPPRMGHEPGAEQREIRRIGERALMHLLVAVRQRALGAEPEPLDRLDALFRRNVALYADRTDLHWTLKAPETLHVRRRHAFHLILARQLFRRRNVGHVDLMGEALFRIVERDAHGKDRLAVLYGDDIARGETAPVAYPVHLENDRYFRVAAEQEIAMQRMRQPVFDGAPRRNQRLADDLSAENALPAILRAETPEQVDFELLKVEEIDKAGNVFSHGCAASS